MDKDNLSIIFELLVTILCIILAISQIVLFIFCIFVPILHPLVIFMPIIIMVGLLFLTGIVMAIGYLIDYIKELIDVIKETVSRR